MKNIRSIATVAILLAAFSPSLTFAEQQTKQDYQRVVKVTDTEKTVLGQQILYPVGQAKITTLIVTLQPGEETGRHLHAVPIVGYILEGEVAITYEGEEEKVFRAGDGFVEAVHSWHNGRAVGDKPVRILAVFLGSENVPAVTRP
ncbi:cupin domain-containing protein [Nitratireductor sp. ZSWI3]|uniref:cupin domain-containing protein n=1 Tax=Nitratireductor sp. ZSWI3 TaxID=2966359 RepID=UPI00215044DB|nr:cupin domain-containing protein [Nitratireductor sp. ZSWI3]MCR4269189.1 cupin domain-containing protein [Nitratireductor sp. ZSWI3]